jgi:hypothetical protein
VLLLLLLHCTKAVQRRTVSDTNSVQRRRIDRKDFIVSDASLPILSSELHNYAERKQTFGEASTMQVSGCALSFRSTLEHPAEE